MSDLARDVIVAALRLARERATGDMAEKEIRRERLADLALRAVLYAGDPGDPGRPTADDLRDVLGDPDDKGLRDALKAWSAGDAPVAQLPGHLFPRSLRRAAKPGD